MKKMRRSATSQVTAAASVASVSYHNGIVQLHKSVRMITVCALIVSYTVGCASTVGRDVSDVAAPSRGHRLEYLGQYGY